MNNIFKQKGKVKIDDNFYLETDNFSGVCLVQHFPAKRKNKEGEETDYTKEERFYYPTVGLALKKYTDLKQIVLPTVEEMLKVQEQILSVLEDFSTKYKNW
jgi:hypothetical protein